jgi:hypothetical protein
MPITSMALGTDMDQRLGLHHHMMTSSSRMMTSSIDSTTSAMRLRCGVCLVRSPSFPQRFDFIVFLCTFVPSRPTSPGVCVMAQARNVEHPASAYQTISDIEYQPEYTSAE